MSFFDGDSYKALLKSGLLARKEIHGTSFTFQKMALACRVQKTYLSRVLNDGEGKAHLSADQLFLAAGYLGLGEEERRFLFLLFERERSTIPARRRALDRELELIRKKHRRVEKALKVQEVVLEGEELRDYYLDPFMQITHMFLTVRRYADEPERIRTELGLEKERFRRILQGLHRLGIVTLDGGKARVAKRGLHLSADSTLLQPYRMLLRLRAMDQIQRLPQERCVSFSVVFSADEKARKTIHAAFLEFLKTAENTVKSTRPEKIYQLNFDLLPWGG